MMKFTFRNLGAMDHATVELAPLTVICGNNNTGKTYISYTIYAFMKMWRELIPWQAPASDMRLLRENGVIKLDLHDRIVSHWNILKDKCSEEWRQFLPIALASPNNKFDKTKVEVDIPLTDVWIQAEFAREARSDQGKVIFSAKKQSGSMDIEIAALQESGETPWSSYALEGFVREVVLDSVFGKLIPKAFMASAERTGAAIFKDELNLTKNKIIALLTQLDKDKSQHIAPSSLFDAVYKQNYALPVGDNVRFVNTLAALEGSKGKLVVEYPELLEELVALAGGVYQTNKDGVTHFIPAGTRTKLLLTEASSATRSLLVLWYWLVGVAQKGDMLMIDEPELNLHPSNQRRMARFIAKLVNYGVYVFITTHSDYIVKEFNTLIMFSQRTPSTRSIADEAGYVEGEYLNQSQVRLYVHDSKLLVKPGNTKRSECNTLTEADISHFGIEVATFDETINAMNAIQEKLYYAPEITEV